MDSPDSPAAPVGSKLDRPGGLKKPAKELNKEELQAFLDSYPWWLDSMSGRLGKFVIRLQRSGKMLVCDRPVRSEKPPSRQQRAHQRQFKRATEYGRRALQDPEKRRVYQEIADRKHISAFNAATQDYLHPPIVERVDVTRYDGVKGGQIRVQVEDTAVATVRVVIRGADGKVLERGDAVCRGHWHYAARKNIPGPQTVQIDVTATDHAANCGRASVYSPVNGGLVQRRAWFPMI